MGRLDVWISSLTQHGRASKGGQSPCIRVLCLPCGLMQVIEGTKEGKQPVRFTTNQHTVCLHVTCACMLASNTKYHPHLKNGIEIACVDEVA